MKILAPFLAFNIILLPILIYLHNQGECVLAHRYFASTIAPLCIHVQNIWVNIAAVNAVALFVGLFMSGGGGGHSGGGKSSGSGSKSGGSSHSSGGGHH